MTKYIQDPVTFELIEANEYRTNRRVHAVHKEIEPFVSHVDGTVVDSRKKLREHNVRNNVVSHADFGNEGETARKEREKLYTASGYDNKSRLDSVRFAFDLESEQRSVSDKKQMIENYQRVNAPKEW